MTDTNTARTHSPRAPVLVVGNSSAGIAHARDVACAFVDGLAPAAATGTAETLALVVSELTTNALRHGGGRYTLELTATDDAVNAAVSDINPAPPRERVPDFNGGTGGFGWPMIRRLTSSVTITPNPGPGKTIHVRLPRRPRAGES